MLSANFNTQAKANRCMEKSETRLLKAEDYHTTINCGSSGTDGHRSLFLLVAEQNPKKSFWLTKTAENQE